MSACPVRTNVPEAMKLYKEGKYEEAAKLLFDNNPFSAITSQVCDWKRLCYGHCILNARNVPVRWYEIEMELSESYLENVSIAAGKEWEGRKVAIAGAGPAGITAAILLREKGFETTIFDDNPEIGGVLRYGIPQFRLDRKYLDQYVRILAEAGVIFKGNVKVGKDISVDDLGRNFDAVIIATGAILPRKLDIPGENNPNVIYALDYLKNPSSYRLGKKVIVIGGGNVTMDACRTAKREGHETWVYYRKTFENMPANSAEIAEAQAEGINFRLFEVPVEIKSGTVVMRKCENITNPDGSISTKMIDGSDEEVPYDTLIIAISAKVDRSIIGTSRAMGNVFSAGDFRLGARTVVEAVESAKTAIAEMTDYLNARQKKDTSF
jgi:glutamate synthase (NADPH/NADH) small chain